LQKLASAGVAVLIILHDLNLAAQYADRVLILKDGKIHAFDTPEKVFKPETIRENFAVNVGVIKHPFFDCPLIIWRDDLI
jgi:iron complex transport system ATP-binding protein